MVTLRLILGALLFGYTFASYDLHSRHARHAKHAKHDLHARVARHATYGVHRTARGVEVKAYSPPSQYQTFGAGIDHPLSKRDEPAGPPDIASSLISELLGVGGDDISFKTSFTDPTAKHVYLKQKINGIEVANAVAVVTLNSEDKVVTFGSNFVTPGRVSSAEPTISLDDAISAVEQFLGGKHNGVPTNLEYYAKDDGSAVLTHVVQVQGERLYEAFVDAETGEVVGVNDFTFDSAFLAVPINKQALNEGQELLENPEDKFSSPDGWNTGSTFTSGNNVIACKNAAGQCSVANLTEQSADGLVFNYPADDSQEPTVPSNVDAARTNTFYLLNKYHDITYHYGFTEASFNFQKDNFGKGGAGNDTVVVYVQDDGVNNAQFHAPPDGQNGTLLLYIWNHTTPGRDGALQNDIVVHEATHGLTNRLTGGGTGRCLQSTESRGLGEGWSDAFAEWTEQTPEVADWCSGKYVYNTAEGSRNYPYSTNKTVNPLTYADLQTRDEVHRIGEVWATMLHGVLAALVDKYGFSSEAFTNPDGQEGNIVYMRLFMDQLSIQPCNPTFLQARDAWIQADVNRYGGSNKCILWHAFADRGLGMNAANHTNDATVPNDC